MAAGDKTRLEAAPSPSEGGDKSGLKAGAAAESKVPVVAGIEGRAKQAAADSKAATEDAKKLVAKEGAESTDDEVKRLKGALTQLTDNDKLSQEMLHSLPPDLAKVMVDAGLVETPEEEQARLTGNDPSKKKFNIIRLPPELTDRYRDPEGIATIPEANSWAATGGNVVIPLPGGGEIRKPSDLKLFHLDG
jgi:hypothetical protein